MAKTKLPFKKSLEELEAIIAWFERGEMDLDEGLKKYERTLELSAACKERMDEFDNKVREIQSKFSPQI